MKAVGVSSTPTFEFCNVKPCLAYSKSASIRERLKAAI